jgi:hypothetical protein
MKVFVLFLLVTLINTGCKKQEPQNDELLYNHPFFLPVESTTNNNIETAESDAEFVEEDANQLSVEETTLKKMEGLPLHEIIEKFGSFNAINYPFNITSTVVLVLQIEGDFTNSGNREIIGFYEHQNPIKTGRTLNVAYCFVCDSGGEKVENVYKLNWRGTIVSKTSYESQPGLNEKLGRVLIFNDFVIGCVSDFNKNGKEELFLFSSGFTLVPNIIEFNGQEFIDILNLEIEPTSTTITDIDPEEKTIAYYIEQTFEFPNAPNIYRKTNNLYIWDDTTQKYELLSTESKSYRWNIEKREYELLD